MLKGHGLQPSRAPSDHSRHHSLRHRGVLSPTAYGQKYYDMVVGFKSGLLGQFISLNIPILSMDLRHIVSEDGHEKLAKQTLKCVNVQYNVPRQEQTVFVAPNSPDPINPLTWNSPFDRAQQKINDKPSHQELSGPWTRKWSTWLSPTPCRRTVLPITRILAASNRPRQVLRPPGFPR